MKFGATFIVAFALFLWIAKHPDKEPSSLPDLVWVNSYNPFYIGFDGEGYLVRRLDGRAIAVAHRSIAGSCTIYADSPFQFRASYWSCWNARSGIELYLKQVDYKALLAESEQ